MQYVTWLPKSPSVKAGTSVPLDLKTNYKKGPMSMVMNYTINTLEQALDFITQPEGTLMFFNDELAGHYGWYKRESNEWVRLDTDYTGKYDSQGNRKTLIAH